MSDLEETRLLNQHAIDGLQLLSRSVLGKSIDSFDEFLLVDSIATNHAPRSVTSQFWTSHFDIVQKNRTPCLNGFNFMFCMYAQYITCKLTRKRNASSMVSLYQ